MEKMERIWQNLWKRKKKKYASQDVEMEESENKENAGASNAAIVTDTKEESVDVSPQKVIVKTAVSGGSKTFPRSHTVVGETQPSPAMPRWKRDPVAASSASLRGRRHDRQDPYDRNKWVSSQHFHVPYGTQPRHASSKGALSVTSVDNVSRSLHRPYSPGSALRAHSPVSEPYSTMRRQVEPYDRYKSSQNMQHFHLPAGRKTTTRLTYGRPGTRTAMTQLVDQIKTSTVNRPRSPSMNNEEPIQLAHYPSGVPGARGIEREDFTAPPFPFTDQERKRRRSGSVGSNQEQEQEEEEKEEEVDPAVEEKLRRHEEELMKISSGIGKVFLDTIKKTEKIRSARMTNIDPRSAARTPAANKMPKYRLRYDSPAWASPSRDTMHGRPWDSEEDLERPVVLTSSGCASGCTSDHLPAAAMGTISRDGYYSSSNTPYARSTSTLVRSIPSLPREGGTATIRSSTPIKPGYTQGRSQTLPHIRSVSGRIISSELELGLEDPDNYPSQLVPNTHSGVVSTVNNSFSWATLAKYQGETMEKDPVRHNFFTRPELKHKITILDK